MRPGNVLGDKTAKKQRSVNGAGHRIAGRVGHVGDRALEILVIRIPQRQPPDGVLDCSRGALNLRSEIVAIHEGRREVGPKRSARRARQSREIDDQLRLVLRRLGKRVGEDQPPFRIGIVDLDEEAFALFDDVARAIGGA